MGFFDKVKKAWGSKKEDIESQNNVNDELIDEPTPNEKIRNFKYLDDLIRSGIKEIVLDSDIILSDNEKSQYEKGIGIDVDNLIIEGNGHSIDAKDKTRIFNIYSKVTIKNLTFKRGYAKDGGAINIHRDGDVDIDGCQFQQNSANRIGGAIFNFGKLSLTNTVFMGNSTKVDGGAIFIGNNCDVEIDGCQFQENTAKDSGGAIFSWGKLSVVETMFMGNSTQEKSGGAINIQRDGDVDIVGCQFQENTANHNGGAILSFGKLSVTDAVFMGNSTKRLDGGAINIQIDGDVDLVGCQFQENTANRNGGAILNLGNLSVTDAMFMGNLAREKSGGAIDIQPYGNVNIVGCQFQENTAKDSGGAIINFSKLSVTDAVFMGNSAQKNSGGAIIADKDGEVDISGCQFQENTANRNGGAIVNFGKLSITETLFNKNTAKREGGVIENVSGSFLRVDDCDFKSNNAENSACICNGSDDVKIIDSIFSNNNASDNLIFNKNNMNIMDCTFKFNENIDCIISSAKESRLTISGGKIMDNTVKKSTIHTEAVECSVGSTTFKNNFLISSNSQCGVDIINEAKLSIQSPKILDDNAILNKGHIDVRKLSHNEAERIIHNVDDASVDEFNPPSEDKFDFTHLNNIIQNGSDEEGIVLKDDISLENYELDFHEGGIDLDMDNLTIDGDNHFIDGKHKTRIFNITGKNITLKNIIFKNGLAMNLYDWHTGGGGAIRIAKNADLTLINCEFIDNTSQDDGGAILNNGTLKSENNKFISNSAEYNAGAIQNNNALFTIGDAFENNASKTAGAIYNNHKLSIKKDIKLKNNSSNLKEDIYNANQVITEDIDLDVEKLIFNTHNINIDENINEWQTFQYLNRKLMDSPLILDENIKIEFNDIDDGVILIDNVEFDGKNHIIDLNNMNINFKIKNNATIKNLTLKNALIDRDSLFEIEGILRLENVKFLNNKINNGCHLLNNRGDVEVIDSHFYNNNSKNNSLISNSHNLIITNTDFINNHSNSEGSIINNTMDNKGKVLIENSLFQYNSTIKSGGTITNREGSFLEISNSKFIKNTAKTDSGAIYNRGKLSVIGTLFIGNSTQELEGGAIKIRSSGDVDIDGCQFQENTAKDGGGAILNGGKLSVTKTLFMGNSTQEWGGGAINNQRGGIINASNIEFNRNIANTHGGAVYTILDENLNLKDCTFKDNKPDDVY